jgi:hypothetical protein
MLRNPRISVLRSWVRALSNLALRGGWRMRGRNSNGLRPLELSEFRHERVSHTCLKSSLAKVGHVLRHLQ